MRLIIDINDNDYELLNKTGITLDWNTIVHGKEKDIRMTIALFNFLKALEHGTLYNPQGDLIIREELKKVLKEKFDDFIPEGVYDEIDNAPTVTPTFGLFKEMLCSECEKRPQGEITNEDIQQAIKEGFANGYEMAKAKFSPKQGEWKPFVYDYDMPENEHGDHIRPPKEGEEQHWEEYWAPEYYCSICGAKNHKANFCPNCGADMKG